MTQTVTLTQPVRVSGSVLAAGTTQTLARDIAADLVARGFATAVGSPIWQSLAQNVQRVIAQSNIPFLIMPGDGGANGCTITGTAGAFTLSAAILANTGATLAGCYAYFSANFGGSTLPAGWYWTEFSSDTAGIAYANTYSSGTPRRPATKTPISVNLTGRITATTNEVAGPSAFLLPKTALGENGSLRASLHQSGSTAGTKSYRVRGDDSGTTALVLTGTAGSPVLYGDYLVQCLGSHTRKYLGRTDSTVYTGSGAVGGLVAATSTVDLDTSTDLRLSVSLRGSTNLAAPILISALITANYGE